MAVVVAVCAGCSGDDADSAPSTSSRPWTVTVPIEIVTSSAPSSRTTTGDPGEDDELDPPANVYAFSWVQTGAGPIYQFCYVARTGLTTSNWTYSLGDGDTEDEDSRYKLNGGLSLTFKSDPYAGEAGVIGHTYVIASETPLTDDQLKEIYSSVTNTSSTLSSGEVVENLTNKPDDDLKAATVSFSDCFTDTNGAWQSDDFRDLYSNPVGNMVDDVYEYGDIYATSDGDGGYTYTHTEVRLYHCAAKIDFTWEVDADLQATTSVESITVSSLPTVCKIFQPTGNSTGDATYTITADDGNKWIGREYFYALQPSEGYLTYGVTFGGSSNRDAIFGASTTKSEDTYSNVFTGWFRVIATVSETE